MPIHGRTVSNAEDILLFNLNSMERIREREGDATADPGPINYQRYVTLAFLNLAITASLSNCPVMAISIPGK